MSNAGSVTSEQRKAILGLILAVLALGMLGMIIKLKPLLPTGTPVPSPTPAALFD